MKNQAHNFYPRMNDWARTSRWLGICSILPYLLVGVFNYIQEEFNTYSFQAAFVFTLVCLFWGAVLGSISLIVGSVALGQIYNSQDTETGSPSAILGIVLGLIGIIANILFCFFLAAIGLRLLP